MSLNALGINTNFEGNYILQGQCNAANKEKIAKALREVESSYSHRVIGLGAAVALLLILLLVVTGGWVWTCWILRKTTDIR
jgi:hypothetical protein